MVVLPPQVGRHSCQLADRAVDLLGLLAVDLLAAQVRPRLAEFGVLCHVVPERATFMVLPVELVHYEGPVSEPVWNPVLRRRIGTTAKNVLYVCKYLSII